MNQQPNIPECLSQNDGIIEIEAVTNKTIQDDTITYVDQINNEGSHAATFSECAIDTMSTNELVDMQLEDVQSTEDSNMFMYTNELRVENNLLKLVTDMNVPNYAFEKIMDWARDAHTSGYQFNPRATNYKSQIQQMQSYSNRKYIRPHIKQTLLPNKKDDLSDTTPTNVV